MTPLRAAGRPAGLPYTALALVAAGVAWGQPAQTTRPVALANPTVPKARQYKIAPQTFRELEQRFDRSLEGLVSSANEPVDLLGETRGVYIDGFGVVFTATVNLVKTPEISPFLKEIPKGLPEHIRKERADRMPLLKTAMNDMLHAMSMTFLQVPNDQHVVLAVRLLYGSWENTAGMPAQIMLRATRAGVQTGEITEEIQ